MLQIHSCFTICNTCCHVAETLLDKSSPQNSVSWVYLKVTQLCRNCSKVEIRQHIQIWSFNGIQHLRIFTLSVHGWRKSCMCIISFFDPTTNMMWPETFRTCDGVLIKLCCPISKCIARSSRTNHCHTLFCILLQGITLKVKLSWNTVHSPPD